MSIRRRITRKVAYCSSLAVIALAVAACGSSTSSESGDRTLPSITIAMPAGFAEFTPIYLAQAKGLFTKYGVKVTMIQDAGLNTIDDVVSGRAGLAYYSPSAGLLAADKGQDITFVYGGNRDEGASLLSESKITSIAQLQRTPNCRIAAPAAGSEGYGYATRYKNLLKLSNCTIIQVSLPALQIGGVKSGTYTAAVTTVQYAALGKSEGENLLINQLDTAQQAKYAALPSWQTALFGLSSTIKANSAAVGAVVKAMIAGSELEGKLSNEQCAEVLQQVATDFKTTPLATLATEVQNTRQFVGLGTVPILTNKLGYISPANWDQSLKGYTTWGIAGFNAASPSNSYSARVDMSYVDAKSV
jgi:ABC-type nitrate/sulfonate/bicarbonate transport system substrate-binding protein